MTNAIKDISGAGGGGGGARVAVEATDTLSSKAFVSLLDLIGEGEIGGLINGAKSVYCDGTPLENLDGTRNFAGVTVESRNGTQAQLPLDGFDEVASPMSVGVKLTKDISYTFAVSNPNTQMVRIILTFPTMVEVDPKTGDTNGSTVSYRISVSTDGGAFQEYAIPTLTGKSRSKYQKSHLITLPPGAAWSIKTERLSLDSTTVNIANEIWLESYEEIVNSRLSYPNSALVSVRIDSSQFNRVPARSYLVDGLYIKVPQNYDPVTRLYTGIWNGTFKLAVSDNPAWILYDVLTHQRYGLGRFILPAQIDKTAVYTIGKYCDGLVDDGFGGQEPRFRLNTAIQSRAEAYKLVGDIASVFRGMAYWAGSAVGFVHDAPVDPSMIYGPANVLGGEFNYTGTARKDRHSVVTVTWNNPADNYKQYVEYVEDAELISQLGVRKLEMLAFGCTSRGQANRVGRWILFTEKYESNFLTFSVGLDSALVKPGDVVRIQDPTRAGKRMAGRIAAATAVSIELDAPVDLAADGATVSMRLPDGTFVDRAVTQGAGSQSSLSWTTPLSVAPDAGAMFIVAEPSLAPMMARVLSMSQSVDKVGEFQISAVEHVPTKYDHIDQGLALTIPQTSAINLTPAAPTALHVAESTYEIAPDVLGIRLDVTWQSSEVKFQYGWRRSDGGVMTDWVRSETSANGFEIPGARAGAYEFEVAAVNWIGVTSQVLKFGHVVVISETTPDAPTNLTLTGGSWNAPSCSIDWVGARMVGEYEVQVWRYATLLRTTVVAATTYAYTLEEMKRDGGPWRTLTLKVRSISAVNGLKSPFVAIVAFNPQVPALNNCTLTPGILSIKFSCDKPTDADWAGIAVWASKVSGFIPDASNLVYTGSELSVELSRYPLLASDTWYVKAAGYDMLGNKALTVSAQLDARPKSIGDGLIPGEIVGADIAAGALTAEKLKTKRHTII